MVDKTAPHAVECSALRVNGKRGTIIQQTPGSGISIIITGKVSIVLIVLANIPGNMTELQHLTIRGDQCVPYLACMSGSIDKRIVCLLPIEQRYLVPVGKCRIGNMKVTRVIV